MNLRLLPLIVSLAALGGCASGGLSGIGGSSDYACAAPPGVSCMSVTGISANAAKNNLPALRARATDETGKSGEKPDGQKKDDDAPRLVAYNASAPTGAERVSPKGMDAPYSGAPLRTPPRVLRIWMAPFEDTDSDLHDQKYLYVTVHTGRWLLEANQVNVQPQFKQVFPLGKKDDAGDSTSSMPQVDANGDPVAPTDKLGASTKR
jgi:conjugal transfer pilus assembly protein TraV